GKRGLLKITERQDRRTARPAAAPETNTPQQPPPQSLRGRPASAARPPTCRPKTNAERCPGGLPLLTHRRTRRILRRASGDASRSRKDRRCASRMLRSALEKGTKLVARPAQARLDCSRFHPFNGGNLGEGQALDFRQDEDGLLLEGQDGECLIE